MERSHQTLAGGWRRSQMVASVEVLKPEHLPRELIGPSLFQVVIGLLHTCSL